MSNRVWFVVAELLVDGVVDPYFATRGEAEKAASRRQLEHESEHGTKH